MREDMSRWLALLIHIFIFLIKPLLIPLRVLGWLNCNVTHKPYWAYVDRKLFKKREGVYQAETLYGRDRRRCSKCGRYHKGKRYNAECEGATSKL